jgi:hypothetical protein
MTDFFNKSFYEFSDIESLILNGIEESLHLEYKEAGALGSSEHQKKEISKDISAFANSDGGMIIYGVKEEGHLPTEITFIDGEKFSKEWFENIIFGNINPKIPELEIHPIRKVKEGNDLVFLVKIPASNLAPHMSRERRFFRRLNFQSVQMEEYEVRNLYNRRSFSELEIQSITGVLSHVNYFSHDVPSTEFEFYVNVANISNTVEYNCKLKISFFKAGLLSPKLSINQHNSSSEYGDDGELIYSVAHDSPIYPQEVLCVLRFYICLKNEELDAFFNINNKAFIRLYYSNGIDECELDFPDPRI